MVLLVLTLHVLITLTLVIGQQVQHPDEELKHVTLVEWIQRNNGGLYNSRIQSVPGMGMAIVTTQPVKVSYILVLSEASFD